MTTEARPMALASNHAEAGGVGVSPTMGGSGGSPPGQILRPTAKLAEGQ